MHRDGGRGDGASIAAMSGAAALDMRRTRRWARIGANARRQIPGHSLPRELSLKTAASRQVLESYVLQKGLALENLEGLHRALTEAVQRGFDQVLGLAAVLAGVGVASGLMLLPATRSVVTARGRLRMTTTEGATCMSRWSQFRDHGGTPCCISSNPRSPSRV